jgi:hypothetical protein
MMDRDTWLRRILDAIRDLVDERYQERVWVRAQGPEVDSSTEALVRLLHDYELAAFIAEAGDKVWVSNDQLAALRSLENALESYVSRDHSSGNEAARIASPAWRRVRKLASAAIETFAKRAASA